MLVGSVKRNQNSTNNLGMLHQNVEGTGVFQVTSSPTLDKRNSFPDPKI